MSQYSGTFFQGTKRLTSHTKVKTKSSGSSKLILLTVVDEFFEKEILTRQHSVSVRKEMDHIRSGSLSPTTA